MSSSLINKFACIYFPTTMVITTLHFQVKDQHQLNNTLHIVSKPTLVSTNWFFRSPFSVTGTPITCQINISSINRLVS